MNYSVVVPMYNSEKTIEKAIQSVLNQTRRDLIKEIIIIDDGSDDSSGELVKKMSNKNHIIKYVRQSNKGVSSARNKGIELANEKMIALLDSDDIWLPNKMEIQDKLLIENDCIKAIGSNRIGEEISFGEKYKENIFKISPLMYCIKCWPCTPSLVFDKSLFNGEKCFPENMTHAEEGLFFLKLANDCGLYYTKKPLVICGEGKRAYGKCGLSANLKKMHIGVKIMIDRAVEKKYINPAVGLVLQIYEEIKYCKRMIFTMIYRLLD